jgi:hypothetical protein
LAAAARLEPPARPRLAPVVVVVVAAVVALLALEALLVPAPAGVAAAVAAW